MPAPVFPRVIVSRGAVWATIMGPEDITRTLWERLSVERPAIPGQAWSRNRAPHRFFMLPQSRVLSGLVPRAVRLIEQDFPEVDVTIREERARPDAGGLWALQGLTPRDYQQTAYQRAITWGRIIVVAPTGSGKTIMGAMIAQHYSLPTLWVMDSSELLRQTVGVLQGLFPSLTIGQVGNSQVREADAPLVVATISTVQRREWQTWLSKRDVLIVDECHHAGSDKWSRVLMRCTRATIRVGLSGTPVSTARPNLERDYQLEGVIGPRLKITDTATLIEQGHLARPVVHWIRVKPETFPTKEQVRDAVYARWRHNPRALITRGHAMFAYAYRVGIIENVERTHQLMWRALTHLRAGEKVLVAVNKIDHAEACARALRLLLQTEEHEHVYVSHRQRRDATLQLEAFKRAPLGVLIGTTMLKEGIDLPGGIDVVVYAAAGESDQAMLQWDGRGLRPRAGKDHVVIYDSFDGTDPWGRRGSPSQDYLALHMRSRYDTYRRHKFAMIAPDVPEEELPHVFPPPDDSAAPRVAHPRRRLV